MPALAEAFVEIRADSTNYVRGINSVKQNLNSNLAIMQKGIQKHAEAIRGLGMLFTATGAAITGSLGMAIRTTGGFQQSMANLQSVAGASSKELRQLTAYAREMGKESVFSAREAGNAMYFLASAGMKSEQIMGALKGTLSLSAATMSDLASTTAVVASTLSAYRLKASEADRVANTFAATISMSQATMDKLANSMQYVGPVAASINMSLEQTTAILGNLYNAGIDGSTAGTTLRFAISSLLVPSDEAQLILAKLGVTTRNTSGEFRDFVDIVRDLEKSSIKAEDALAIFGERAGPGMLALVNQGADALEKLTEEVTGTDKASKMAAMQIDTFQGNMKLFKSAIEELQISIGTQLLPTLTDFTKKITEVVNKITDWTEAHPKLTEVIAKFSLAMGGLMVAGGPLLLLAPTLVNITAALPALTAGIAKMGTAFTGLALGPVGIAIAGVAAGISLVAAALVLYKDAKKDIFTQREMDAVAGNIKGIEKAIKDYTSQMDGLEKHMIWLKTQGVDPTTASIRRFGKSVKISDEIKNLQKKIADLQVELAEAKGDIFHVSDLFKKQADNAGAAADNVERLAEELAKARGELQKIDKFADLGFLGEQPAPTSRAAMEEYLKRKPGSILSIGGQQRAVYPGMFAGQVAADELSQYMAAGFLNQLPEAPDRVTLLKWLTRAKTTAFPVPKIPSMEIGRALETPFLETEEGLADFLKRSEALYESDAQNAIEAAQKKADADRQWLEETYAGLDKLKIKSDTTSNSMVAGWHEAMAIIKEDSTDWTTTWLNTIDGLKYAFSDFVYNFISGTQSLSEAWGTFCDDLKRIAITKLADIAVSSLFQRIFGELAGVGAGTAMGAATGAAITGLGSLVASLGGWATLGPLGLALGVGYGVYKMGGFAKGGLVTHPTFAMLGEEGPELVLPLGRSKGTVLGNNSSRNITMNIYDQDLSRLDPVRLQKTAQQAIIPALDRLAADGVGR